MVKIFFCLTYVEPKHQSNEHNQAGTNDFQCLIWTFWICQLSPVWYNVDCSVIVLIWSLSTSTCLPDRGASSSEKSPARNFANHFWHVQSVTAPSPYTAQIFSCFSYVFTLLEIIKHNMLKMLFSSIFSSKMAIQKFTNFDKSFFKCMLIWQLSHRI